MFTNNIVAITGKMAIPRQSIVSFIESEGGTISSSITKKVTHLICANPSDSSTKLKKARDMGIKIVGEDSLDIPSEIKLSSSKKRPSSSKKEREVSSKKVKVVANKTTTNLGEDSLDIPSEIKLSSSKKRPSSSKKEREISSKKVKVVANKTTTNLGETGDDNGEGNDVTGNVIGVGEGVGKGGVVGEFDRFVKKMLSSNANLDKQKIFIDFVKDASSDFIQILKVIYHKQLKFGITSKNILKFEDGKWNHSRDYVKMKLIDFVDQLVGGDISGHDALKAAISFLTDYSDYRETLLLIFNKDLKLRFGLNLVNKAIPDFVPVFNVSLGYGYDDKTSKHVETGDWFISKKLDGVRCITIINFDANTNVANIEFFSRGGLKFKSLAKVESELQTFIPTVLPSLSQFKKNIDGKDVIKIVLDGEMCIIDENGNEDFRSIVSQIKRKSVTVERPRYLVFDMLTWEEFKTEKSKRIFSDRLNVMKQLFPSYQTDILKYKEEVTNENENEIIKLLPQLPFTEEMFSIMSKQAEKQKWEGLMLRKDTVYSGKRSNDLLKVKEFETEEYIVKDVVFGIFPVINEDSGLQEDVEMLASVVINHKGLNTTTNEQDIKVVNVGSGFSLDERRSYHANPDLIKGKTISVQFFQTIRSRDGKESLRFPTFKGMYGSKRVL
jgi:ATP dependent DNA ligase domain/BRCA1 C Terminus (BRCT) domain